MTLWKLFLLILPLLDAVRDVDSDALGAKVSAADVARHGHSQKVVWRRCVDRLAITGKCQLLQGGNTWSLTCQPGSAVTTDCHQGGNTTHKHNIMFAF